MTARICSCNSLNCLEVYSSLRDRVRASEREEGWQWGRPGWRPSLATRTLLLQLPSSLPSLSNRPPGTFVWASHLITNFVCSPARPRREAWERHWGVSLVGSRGWVLELREGRRESQGQLDWRRKRLPRGMCREMGQETWRGRRWECGLRLLLLGTCM